MGDIEKIVKELTFKFAKEVSDGVDIGGGYTYKVEDDTETIVYDEIFKNSMLFCKTIYKGGV